MPTTASSEIDISRYHYGSAAPAHSNDYLLPAVFKLLRQHPPPSRIFELGCGNGAVADILSRRGYDLTAVDPSIEGIDIAKKSSPHVRFAMRSAYDNLSEEFGTFQIVISLEVVEHVFYPRKYAATIAALLGPGGSAIISTPYHGYIKNLTLSLFNKWDTHMNPLWDYGHIKLWSRSKLVELFREAGLVETDYRRVGRIPQLAKSMVLTFKRG